MEIQPGQWLVTRGYNGSRLRPELHQADKATTHRVKCGSRYIDRSVVMAVFTDQNDADKLIHHIASVYGEHERRVISARLWADKEVDAAIARALGTGEVG